MKRGSLKKVLRRVFRLNRSCVMRKKLRELTLYIAQEGKGDPAFGMVKLYKTLFVADFGHYAAQGKAVTEAQYVHGDHGPIPDSMSEVIDSLEGGGRIQVIERDYFDKIQKRVQPLDEPDMSLFSKDEKEWIDRVIQHLKPFNATQLKNWGHDLLPYQLTRDGEEIPYYCVFMLEDISVEPEDIKWGKAELERLRKEKAYAH